MIGPDREENRFLLTDAEDVRDARRVLFTTAPGADPDWLSEVEAFDSAADLAAARELEEWGYNPFQELDR